MTHTASPASPVASAAPPAAAFARGAATPRTTATQPVLGPWIRAQGLNLTRHTNALRDFTRAEFGTGPEAPTEGHEQAVNHLLADLRRGLTRRARHMGQLTSAALRDPGADD